MTASPSADQAAGPAASDPSAHRDPASFRDPSGFVFRRDGVLYRQVNASFEAEWRALEADGLLRRLQAQDLLIAHETVEPTMAADPSRAIAVIAPEPVPFISYPYEWTFGEMKDAALLTLDLQAQASAAGFTLRDASAYNIQFHHGRPILIDTLSFEPARPDAPWVAYRQFCEHFLAPLALMAHRDVRLGLLQREFVDGIPLDLAATLLPGRTRFGVGLGSHVHLHARAQRRYADRGPSTEAARERRVGSTRRAALLDSLRRTVEKLRWEPSGTEWADYDRQTSYTDEATRAKEDLVRQFLEEAGGDVVWDMGANIGRFSAIAASLGRRVVAWDVDAAASERHYRNLRAAGHADVLPLVEDLMNPSPALGWAGRERHSITDRADADVVLALALVHHLAIARNVPLPAIADWFASLGPGLVIEFVPKGDPMVDRLLATREDIFPDYTLDGFRAAFADRYEILAEMPIAASPRTLFRMRRR